MSKDLEGSAKAIIDSAVKVHRALGPGLYSAHGKWIA
jgi:hypothetical protein